MPKITKRLVDSSHPRDTKYFIWDSTLIGFGLAVLPSGTKSYCFQYRDQRGKSCRITLGKQGGPYTADQAYKRAKELQGIVVGGGDPVAEKKEKREALTVANLLDEYLQSEKFALKTEITRKNDAGRIKRHLKPLLGRKIANNLTVEQIRKARRDIEDGKTAVTVRTGPRGLARVTGGPGAARMAIRLLKSAFTWAMIEDLISNNATLGFKLSKDGEKGITIEGDDYQKLFKAINALEEVMLIRQPVADAIRVIAFTGARRGEIAGLRWRHVDLKKGVVTIPWNEHKTGKKTEEPRIIGLPTDAQEIIARQDGGQPEEYVFPPASGVGPLSLSKPWRAIRKEAGLDPQMGLHGLRHSVATNMAASGSQAGHIMKVLGHRDLATSQKYIHIAEQKTQELAESAAAGISAAFKGKKPGKVVSIKGGKGRGGV